MKECKAKNWPGTSEDGKPRYVAMVRVWERVSPDWDTEPHWKVKTFDPNTKLAEVMDWAMRYRVTDLDSPQPGDIILTIESA